MRYSYDSIVAILFCSIFLTCGVSSGGGGLHLPRKDRVQGRIYFNDGKGYTWDIEAGIASVQQGRNYCYSGAMLLYVDGGNFYSTNSQAWRDQKNREIESGPWNRGKLRVYRRVRVYSDRPLARWMDIFENTSASKVTLDVRLRVNINHGIGKVITNTGGKIFGKNKKDFAFITTPRRNRGGTMALHIPFGAESRVKPRVNVRNNSSNFEYHFTLTIPPGKTVILAYFESQGTSRKSLEKVMKNFDPEECFADLDSDVRAMILNFPPQPGRILINLKRHPLYDRVELVEGNTMFGSVVNSSVVVDTGFGKITLPCGKIVGMLATTGDPGHFRTLLADGQIVSGKVTGQKLQLEIPSVGVQNIPFEDIRSWAFKVSSEKPRRITYHGPYISTLGQDRLIFKNTGLGIRLQTPNGTVSVKGDELFTLKLDNPGKAHQVMFLNGSTLSGLVENAEFDFDLSLFGKRKIDRSNISEMEFAEKIVPADKPAQLKLFNGDILYGRFTDRKLQINARYGAISFDPAGVRSIVRVPGDPDTVLVSLWNQSVLRGKMSEKQLEFTVIPGPVIILDSRQITSFSQVNPAPPETILKNVEALIKKLGSDNYKVRTQAQKDLIKLGPDVVEILKKHLNTNDLEVRTRLNEIIEQLKSGETSSVLDGDEGGLRFVAAI